MIDNWYLRSSLQPVLDAKKENFLVTVITPYENTHDLENRMDEARYRALLSIILRQNRYVTRESFLEILEDTEATDWYIDPRPCSKLRVLVSIKASSLNHRAPHSAVINSSQVPRLQKNRIYGTLDRVEGAPPIPYPALRFMERLEGLQDQLAEDTKNNISGIVSEHVSDAAYYEEDLEPCANPEVPPEPAANSRGAFNDVLNWSEAPPGTRYTEIPTKEFKKMVDDFAKVLEGYHDEIQDSDYTVVPPVNLRLEARKLKQIPGLLDKFCRENTYQEYAKTYDIGTAWEKVALKNLAVEGGKLRKNKDDVLQIGLSEDFNVNFVALNQKNFWRLDNWKVRKEYDLYRIVPGARTTATYTHADRVAGRTGKPGITYGAVIVTDDDNIAANDEGEAMWDGAVAFKRAPPVDADYKTLLNLAEGYVTPEKAQQLPFSMGLRVKYWVEEKNGYVQMSNNVWMERAHLEPMPPTDPNQELPTWTEDRQGRLTRDPTEEEKNGEIGLPKDSCIFGGEAAQIKREAVLTTLFDIGCYPAHWRIPELGWSDFKKSPPICSATTMSLLFYMVQFFQDVQAGKFGGGNPDWLIFLGSGAMLPEASSKRMELVAAGYPLEEIEQIMSERFGGYIYSPPEITKNPPAAPAQERGDDPEEPDTPPWAPQEEGKLLKDLRKEFDENPIKSVEAIRKQDEKMLAPGIKEKIRKDRKKLKQNVADNITQDIDSLMNRIHAVEDVYTQVLDKYGIENLIKLALECLAAQTGIPFDQLPSIDALLSISCPPPPTFSPPTLPDVVMEAKGAIPGLDVTLPIPAIPGIPNPCKPPPKAPRKPKFPKIPTSDLMGPILKEIGEMILQMLLEALLQIILMLLQMLLEMCINEGNAAAGNFGEAPISDRLGIDPAMENALNNFGIPPGALGAPTGDGLGLGPDGAPMGAPGAKGLFDDIGNCLTPSELCGLLSGNPSPQTLSIVEGIISSQYPELRSHLTDRESIRGFFQAVGKQTQMQALCAEIDALAAANQINLNVCTTEERDALRCALLQEKGLSKEECAELLDKARCRQKDAFDDLMDLLKNPNILSDVLPDNLIQSPCNPEGIIPRDPPFMMRANERMIDSMLGIAISAFQNDIDAYVPMLLAAAGDHFGLMGMAVNAYDMPYDIFPAYSIGPGADHYLRANTGIARRELKYKINNAKQYGYDRLDGRDPVASWDGDSNEVPNWMRKSSNRRKYRNPFYYLWLGRSKVGDSPNIKDPPPSDPLNAFIERMKLLERLPAMPHHMVYRVPKLNNGIPEFGNSEKTEAQKLVLPTLKQGLDDVQETTLAGAEAELKSYLGVTEEILAAAGISGFKASVNQSRSNRTSPAGTSPLSTFIIGKLAEDADRSLSSALKRKINTKLGSADSDKEWDKIRDVSRVVADSRYFMRENLKALDWTPEDRPPHCPPPHPNKKRKGLLDPDDAKEDAMKEYATASCEEDADAGVDGPGPLELSMLASIINLIIRVHIIEIAIKGLFVFSEYNIQDTFKDPAVVKFLVTLVRNNLKYNMVFDNLPASKSFFEAFSDRTVQLVERRVRRGEIIQLPDGTTPMHGQKISINDAIEIIAREQIPEVSTIIGEILNSPDSDESTINAMPMLDVPNNVRSNGTSDSKRFGEFTSRINSGMFFIERYIRVVDKSGSSYLDRDDKLRGAVNLGVWQKYWNNVDLGSSRSREAKARKHFKSWKFGYRICFLSKHNDSIVRDFFKLTGRGWERNQQRREKTYKLKDDGKWYYPIVISAAEETIPFSTIEFVPGGFNSDAFSQIDIPDEGVEDSDKIKSLMAKKKALEDSLKSALKTGETQIEKKLAADHYKNTNYGFSRDKYGWFVEGSPGLILTWKSDKAKLRRKKRDRLIWTIKKYNVKKLAGPPIPGIDTGGVGVPGPTNIPGWPNYGNWESSPDMPRFGKRPMHTGMRQNTNRVLRDAIQAKINSMNAHALTTIIIDNKIVSVETPHNPTMFDSRGRPKPAEDHRPAPPGIQIPLIMNKDLLLLVPGGKRELERIVRLYLYQFDRAVNLARELEFSRAKGGSSGKEADDLKKAIAASIKAAKGVKNKTGISAKDNSLKKKLGESAAFQQAVGGSASTPGSANPLSTVAVYTINSVEAQLGRTSLQLFRQTKSTLKMLFGMLENSGDPHYEDPEQPNSLAATRQNARHATTDSNDPNIAAMILKMIFMTPLYILKGLAELIDPNIIVSNILRRLSTDPEQHIKHIVFPPGMFGSHLYELTAPKPPKPPKPPAPPVLGEPPWLLPEEPELRGTDPDQIFAHEKAMERYNMVVDVITENFDKVVGPVQEAYDEYNEFWGKMKKDHEAHKDGTRTSPETVDFTPKNGFPTFPLIPLTPLGIVYLLLEFEDNAEKERRSKKQRKKLAKDGGGDEC